MDYHEGPAGFIVLEMFGMWVFFAVTFLAVFHFIGNPSPCYFCQELDCELSTKLSCSFFVFFLMLCTQVPVRCFHYGDSIWKCVMNLNIFLFAFSVDYLIIASSTGALFPHCRSWLLVMFTNLNKCASHQKPYNTMERYSSERGKDSLG